MDNLQQKSQQQDFWNEPQQAGQILKQIEKIKQEIDLWQQIKQESMELIEFVDSINEDQIDELSLVTDAYKQLSKNFLRFEKQKLYSGKYDGRNAFLSIHSGAGGVEAQDWSQMLLRMYLRYCERKNYYAKIVDETRGTEAGIKSVTVEIKGDWAYGNMRAEAGVHRLVRQSPFNADNLRQTSFALVEVIPFIENDAEVEINPKELRIDTFRSSGAGGQHVNTTDSAVRITHIPTNIVISCQSERSQQQNKDRCLSILKAKLLQKQEHDRMNEQKQMKGEHKLAGWGNQIRSYVLHPYQMVKDHRTNHETSDTQGVLDGKIDEFIDEYLRKNF